MLRNHKQLILNWFKADGRLSSGTVEGFNLKAKLTNGTFKKTDTDWILNIYGG